MDPIKMVDLQALHQAIRPELDEAIATVVNQAQFIFGPQVKHFENELASYLGVKHVISCANGTDALQLAMMALDLSPGSEIIIPSFNYVSAAEAALLLGLRPVFAEIDPHAFTLDPADVLACINKKTKAIVAVHLFGQCADLEKLIKICRDNNLFLIEDNAQALGAGYRSADGRISKAGTIGHIATTSFFPTKTLGCMGDGGALFTQDSKLDKKLRQLAFHGQSAKYHYDSIGINSRLDTLQAAILSVKLKGLDEMNSRRREVARQYMSGLAGTANFILPKKVEFSDHVYHQFTLRTSSVNRGMVIRWLHEAGIPTNIYYPAPLHQQGPYQDCRHSPLGLAKTETVSKEVFSIPMHPNLKEGQIAYIIKTLTEIDQRL